MLQAEENSDAFTSLCAPAVKVVDLEEYSKHNYQPSFSLIIPSSFKEHPSANHYSVQSQISIAVGVSEENNNIDNS